MMKRAILFIAMSLIALAGCAEMMDFRVLGTPSRYLAKSDDQLWNEAFAHSIGRCHLVDQRAAKESPCRYYLKVNGAKWLGGGWPVDATTLSGNGCVAPREIPENHVGPSPAEYKMSIAGLRSAIADPSNPCGLMSTTNMTTTNLN